MNAVQAALDFERQLQQDRSKLTKSQLKSRRKKLSKLVKEVSMGGEPS